MPARTVPNNGEVQLEPSFAVHDAPLPLLLLLPLGFAAVAAHWTLILTAGVLPSSFDDPAEYLKECVLSH